MGFEPPNPETSLVWTWLSMSPGDRNSPFPSMIFASATGARDEPGALIETILSSRTTTVTSRRGADLSGDTTVTCLIHSSCAVAVQDTELNVIVSATKDTRRVRLTSKFLEWMLASEPTTSYTLRVFRLALGAFAQPHQLSTARDSRKASSPNSPNSRPMPDCLKPPNGASGSCGAPLIMTRPA
jgi:hypothetical protein